MTTHGERLRRRQLQYRLFERLALLPNLAWLRLVFWLALGLAGWCWLPYIRFDRADALLFLLLALIVLVAVFSERLIILLRGMNDN